MSLSNTSTLNDKIKNLKKKKKTLFKGNFGNLSYF